MTALALDTASMSVQSQRSRSHAHAHPGPAWQVSKQLRQASPSGHPREQGRQHGSVWAGTVVPWLPGARRTVRPGGGGCRARCCAL
jgi:hypothetical protein